MTLAATWARSAALGPGDWFTPGNWSPAAVPVGFTTAEIGNGGTAQITSGLAQPFDVRLGFNPGESGTLSVLGGTLQPNGLIFIGSAGRLMQSAGIIAGAIIVGFGASGGGTVDLNGGSLSSDFINLNGAFLHSGGTASINTFNLQSAGVYRLTGGTLNLANLPGSTGGSIDLSASSGTINYSGLVDLSTVPLTGGTSTTVTGGANSLLMIAAGFDPNTAFGSFSTSGLVHTVGTPLTIPTGVTTIGNGTINDRVFVDGTLTGITLGGGVNVSATGSLSASSLFIRDLLSGSSGNLAAGATAIGDTGATARFTQAAGNVSAGFLTIGINSTYVLSGGTMALTGATSIGTLDFASGGGTLSASGIANFGVGTLVNTSAANLVVGNNSLLIVPPGFNPAGAFGSFVLSPSALVHNAGATLLIPAGTTILSPSSTRATINDFVQAAGTLNGEVNLAAGVAVLPSGYLNIGFGSVIVDNASSNNNGTLLTRQIIVGNAGSGSFTQTGGQTGQIATFIIGNLPGANGTLTLNTGSLSGTAYVGYSGAGTLELNGGQIDGVRVGYNSTGIGTFHFSSGKVVGSPIVGDSGVGTVIQDGTSTIAMSPNIGANPGGRGTYLLSAGAISDGFLKVGQHSAGTFNQTGGVVQSASVTIGDAFGTGTYILSAGSLNGISSFTSTVYVGRSGIGFMQQTGGSVSAGSMTVSESSNSGTYMLSGGSVTLQQMRVGTSGHANGNVFQSGGSISITNGLGIASGALAPTGRYDLTAGSLSVGSIFLGSSSGGGTATFNQSGGVNTITRELSLNALSRYNYSGGTVSSGTIQLNGGTFTLSPGHGLVVNTNGIANSSGAIDLGDGAMIVNYTSASPLSSIRALASAGFAGGSFTGTGIRSMLAATVAADSANAHKTAIGFAESSTLGAGSFAGQSVDTTTVLLRYTFSGDANLDGTVNNLDFTALAAHFNASSQLWTDADFNFDGQVNAIDFNSIASNYGSTLASPPAFAPLVPEPAGVAVISLLAASGESAVRRRRR